MSTMLGSEINIEAFENDPYVVQELVGYNNGSSNYLGERALRSLDLLTDPGLNRGAISVAVLGRIASIVVEPGKRLNKWVFQEAKTTGVRVEDFVNPTGVYVPVGTTHRIDALLSKETAAIGQ